MPACLAVAASLLALILAAEHAEAKPESRRDGRISFIVGESGDIGPTPRLVVMDADGTNRRVRLGYVYHASLSADGRFIAYDPRVHGDADLQLVLLGDPVADRQRRTHGSLRIVLTGDRRAEEGDDGIADELLYGAAPPLELVAQPLVVRAQDLLDIFRIELLGRRREADEVGEEDGDDLALSAELGVHLRSVRSPRFEWQSRRIVAGRQARAGQAWCSARSEALYARFRAFPIARRGAAAPVAW